MAILREIGGSRDFPLAGKVTMIGRDPSCDLVVGNPETSGRHAIIVNTGGTFFIEDLDSVNGTFVNGKRISLRTRLAQEDRIELSGLKVNFHDDRGIPSTNQDTATLNEEQQTGTGAPIMSSMEVSSDLRLTVKPETKLRAILEMSKNLGYTLDLKVVLPKTLESLFAIFPQADCGSILLRDNQTGKLVPRAVRHRHEPKNTTVPLSRGIIEHVLRTNRAILSADASSDVRFDASQSISHLKIRSIMCVPMISQAGKSLGIIQIDTRGKRNEFHQEDLDLLVCASIQAARALELAQLHEERRDLEAATRIQKSFLPAERPNLPHLKFFDYYSPAQHVGGDYFDYIPLSGNRLAVALGDVSGKGISAALLMARVSSAARFCLATEASPAKAVREINRMLVRSGSEERFVTFVVLVIDVERSLMTLVNAGHMPPLLRQPNKSVTEIAGSIVGLPLAVMDRPYEESVMPLKPGDTVTLYTDGVTEARNPSNEMYGSERLVKAIKNAPPEVEQLGKTVLDDVTRFAAERPQNDDLTIVCFSYLP